MKICTSLSKLLSNNREIKNHTWEIKGNFTFLSFFPELLYEYGPWPQWSKKKVWSMWKTINLLSIWFKVRYLWHKGYTSGVSPYSSIVLFNKNHCFLHLREILVLFISQPLSSWGCRSSSLCALEEDPFLLDRERLVRLFVRLSVPSEDAIALICKLKM